MTLPFRFPFRVISKMAEKKQGFLDKYFSLSKSHSEPPHRQEALKERIRDEFHGDPANNKYGQKYLDMTLDEKRKLYKCGKNFERIDDLVLWPILWHVKQDEIKKKGKPKGLHSSYSVNDDLNKKICLHQGDITKLEIDAIVNAANTSLLGGGGVDGAIHRSAGSSLYDECKTLHGCNTGDAKITSGHRLPAKYIIHTVGPFGKHETYLRQCYNRCLETSLRFNIKTLAFACISTGVYGYPQLDAAHVALQTARNWLEDKEKAKNTQLIIFCVYLKQDWDIYTNLLQYYFPCENVSKEKKTTEKKEIEELEADVLNKDNIPDANMDDLVAMLEEEKQSSDATGAEIVEGSPNAPIISDEGLEKNKDVSEEEDSVKEKDSSSEHKEDSARKKTKVEEKDGDESKD